jgi:hypothetical protein
MADKRRSTGQRRDDGTRNDEAQSAERAMTLVDGLTHAGDDAPGTGMIDQQASVETIEAVANVLEKQEHLEERPDGVTPGDRPNPKRKP